MKHTPGKWIVNVWTTGRRTIEQMNNTSSNYPICEVHQMHNDEQRANANLIAAAPELLKACKSALLCVIGSETLLKKAITKAEGK